MNAGLRPGTGVEPFSYMTLSIPETAHMPRYQYPTQFIHRHTKNWHYPDSGGLQGPLTFCEHSGTGAREWRWKGFAPLRPLFGLNRLAARPDAPVVVVEGEKAADAAGRLLPGFVVITSPGGSNAAGRPFQNMLYGRLKPESKRVPSAKRSYNEYPCPPRWGHRL